MGIFGCSASSSICYRRACYCKYGYVASTNSGDCVRDYSWPTSLEELRAVNASFEEIEEFIEQTKNRDEMLAQNKQANIMWAGGAMAFVVGSAVLMMKRK